MVSLSCFCQPLTIFNRHNNLGQQVITITLHPVILGSALPRWYILSIQLDNIYLVDTEPQCALVVSDIYPFVVKMAAILKKMADILAFQVAQQVDLTSNPQRIFVPKLVLVSQFARLVPLSAQLGVLLLICLLGAIQVLCNAFFLEIRHPPTPSQR